MIVSSFKILENINIGKDIYLMKVLLEGFNEDLKPGQFVNISIVGKFLKRPISVCDYEDNILTLIYKVVGEGTKILSEMKEYVSLMLPLGNGFSLDVKDKVTLVGGGVGVPPMYYLAKELIKRGIETKVVLGFKNLEESFYVEEFKSLGLEIIVFTDDGTLGVKGLVTQALEEEKYVFTCGPYVMLKEVHKKSIDGQFSFEERMGCGFGACMGCSCKTKYGYKRICKEGPVLTHGEILW